MITRITSILFWLFLAVIAFASSWWGIFLWQNRNLLSKYGVSYEKTYGEHESFQELQFYWDRNGKRITGPKIIGDDLYVRFKNADHEEAPEIIVHSIGHDSRFTILKLNFTDANKPEFEIVANQMMAINYPSLDYHWP